MSAAEPAPDALLDIVLASVLAAYRTVLERPAVGTDDDFFELGGDSLQAMDVLSLLDAELGTETDVAVLFSHPTPAELAAVVIRPTGPAR